MFQLSRHVILMFFWMRIIMIMIWSISMVTATSIMTRMDITMSMTAMSMRSTAAVNMTTAMRSPLPALTGGTGGRVFSKPSTTLL